MYKVFFNDTIVILTNSFEFDGFHDGSLYLKYNFASEIREALNLLAKDMPIHTLFLQSADLDGLWVAFQSHFQLIFAAGGLVSNRKGEFLLIHRNGKWDLPKGKIEIHEEIEHAALREVEEECGIDDLILGKKLVTTYHTYQLKGKEVLKATHWYAMRSEKTVLTPQIEEGIDQAIWANKQDTENYIANTFPTIRLVYDAFVQAD